MCYSPGPIDPSGEDVTRFRLILFSKSMFSPTFRQVAAPGFLNRFLKFSYGTVFDDMHETLNISPTVIAYIFHESVVVLLLCPPRDPYLPL